jgi:hypothetical protein
MPYDDDATGASVKPSSIPTIEDIPAEYPLPHDASVWTQKMEDSLGPLLAVAKGKWPASALLIMDEPLENYPELPEDHPHYLRRQDHRLRLRHQQKVNEKKRLTLLLEARTAIYKALKKACDKNAPCLAHELSIKCNLKSYQGGMYEGYFEGKRAYDMVMTRMTIKATQNDDNLYRTAERTQRDNRLPKGCSAAEFDGKYLSFIRIINPNLPVPYVGEKISLYIIDLSYRTTCTRRASASRASPRTRARSATTRPSWGSAARR